MNTIASPREHLEEDALSFSRKRPSFISRTFWALVRLFAGPEKRKIVVSAEEWERLQEELGQPPEVKPRLKKLLSEPSILE
jgi:hypothetical protein